MNIQQIWHWLKAKIQLEFIWWALAAVGIVLRLRQYFLDLSISTDESALAVNVVTRNFSGLTQPLGFNQGAPIVFLFIEKFFILILGNKDYILRIFPLCSGLMAIYLFYVIAKKYFGHAGLLAFFAFILCSSIISYSSYAKPYSSDITIALLLFYLSDLCIREDAKIIDFIILGVSGIIVLWISNPSVFLLAGIGLVLVFEKLTHKNYKGLVWTFGAGFFWLAALGINYLISLRYLAASSYLLKYWSGAFMPLPPWGNPKWLIDTYLSLLSVSLDRTELIFAISCGLLIFIGSVSFFVKNRPATLIMILSLVMALIASGLKKYPLQERFLLFMVPFVYLLIAEGLIRVYMFIAKRNHAVALIICGVILITVFKPEIGNTTRNFLYPSRSWDLRPVMENVVKNYKPGDIFYVSGGGEIFDYYSTVYGLKTSHVILRNTHRIVGLWAFENDLKALAGTNRVWIIFAHFESPANQIYVRTINQAAKIEMTFQSWDARGYLCNLYPR